VSEPTAPQVPRLYIASDLHLAEGLDPRTRRYARLEGFFYDEEFASFLAKCAEDAGREPAILILNGDVFDFLSCLHVPSRPDRKALGFGVSGFERKYGLASSETKAVWKLDQVLKGHPAFFTALVRWMALGHRVVLIRGNHDLELFWPAV
jgi:UDP-2,3-diacylglucosamine pyrophosphatase LpxH